MNNFEGSNNMLSGIPKRYFIIGGFALLIIVFGLAIGLKSFSTGGDGKSSPNDSAYCKIADGYIELVKINKINDDYQSALTAIGNIEDAKTKQIYMQKLSEIQSLVASKDDTSPDNSSKAKSSPSSSDKSSKAKSSPSSSDKSKKSVSVLDYGANGSDSNDDTQAFIKAIATGNLVEVPTGNYYIKWKSSYKDDSSKLDLHNLVGVIHGKGKIISMRQQSEHVPNTYWPKAYANTVEPFTAFTADNVNDSLLMSMYLNHERKANLKSIGIQIEGPQCSSYSVGSTGNIVNTWGQFFAANGVDLSNSSQKVDVNVGAMGMMGYSESSKKWEIIAASTKSDGGIFNFSGGNTSGGVKVTPKSGYTNYASTAASLKTDCAIHFWVDPKVDISNKNGDYKYFIYFMDMWSDDDWSAKNLVVNVGGDIRNSMNQTQSIPSLASSGFLNVTKEKKRIYAHNMNEDVYMARVSSKSDIDKIIDSVK